MWELQRETFTAILGTGGSRGALLVWVLLVVNKMEKQEKTGKTSPFKLLLPGCSKTRRHSYTPGG